MSLIYRKFAQSLDEVASVLFVMMGEALSNVGFGGRYLLQAPYSELQVRRDAVIYALRNLVGATQEAYAPNERPEGSMPTASFSNGWKNRDKAIFALSWLKAS